MKTRCPNCETIFRVTPVQLKARAGKVRCGQCQHVFNALDGLLDDSNLPASASPSPAISAKPTKPDAVKPVIDSDFKVDILLDEVDFAETPAENPPDTPADEDALPLSESAAQELGKATGLILPRETTEIPGYSKWAEGVVSTPFSLPPEKRTRWPFVLAAFLLTLTFVGQLTFQFRSDIAAAAPALRPMLETLCQTLNIDLPLPRHPDLVGIVTSDLQADPAHGNLLALNATLRNRASFAQAYPSLELSLTDTADAAIARRVLSPDEYLPLNTSAKQEFAANSELVVRLWIEARKISAAGYRLYVFYP